MRSRLLRICLLALAAFALMPGTAMALGSSASTVDSRLCWTGQCPEVCVPMGTFQVCVLIESVTG
jgi:hypothetical protein